MTVRQSDAQRMMAAAIKAGAKSVRVEIEDGKIVVYASMQDGAESVDQFQAWKAKRNARQT